MTQPPEAPALTRRGAIVVAAIALCLAVGAFSVGSASGSASARAATLANTANHVATLAVTPAPVAPILPGDGAALAVHLLTPPATLRSIAVSTRTVDIPGLSVAGLLVNLGYASAITAGWQRDDGGEARTALIQFAAPTGPVAFVAAADNELTSTAMITKHFAIPGINTCFGDDDNGFDSAGRRSSTLLCANGTVAIVMSLSTAGELDDNAEIAALQQQINALSA